MQKKIQLKINSKSHISFSKSDDERLRQLVKEYGENWGKIAEKMMNKSPRQCRERYISYLDPNIVNGPWTPEEDERLKQSVLKFGTKWVTLTKFFPGRSDNNLKNRWHTYLKNQCFPSYSSSLPQVPKHLPSPILLSPYKIETPHITQKNYQNITSINHNNYPTPINNHNPHQELAESTQNYLNYDDFFNEDFQMNDLYDLCFKDSMFSI